MTEVTTEVKLRNLRAGQDRTYHGLGYGPPHQLAALMDSVGQSLWEEPQDQWDDKEVRASAESLRDLLTARLEQ